MKKFSYIHLIDNEIVKANELHPFNDKSYESLSDKEKYMECFMKDVSDGTAKSLNGDDDYGFTDISNGKRNLFNFRLTNGQDYNIYIEHSDGGGRDISFNDPSKKVLIPYSNISFRKMIKDMKNILVVNVYFELTKREGEKYIPNLNRYVYLVVIPSEIYTSEVVYNILYNYKTANGSSRWVTLQDIKKCLNTKQTGINKNGNVGIIHPDNISDFLSSVVIDDYKNQFQRAYVKLLEITYGDKKYSHRQSEVLQQRQKLRKKLLLTLSKCEISTCDVSERSCLVASHIGPVNKILSDQKLNGKKKIEFIGDVNNAFLLCNLHDKLFDRFLISFDNEGKLMFSKLLKNSYAAYHLQENIKCLSIKEETKFFLEKHRKIFKDCEDGRVT